MQFIYKRFGVKTKTTTAYNHGSLQTEIHVRTISEVIAKQLAGKGQI